jgi:hypothetical protein
MNITKQQLEIVIDVLLEFLDEFDEREDVRDVLIQLQTTK